MRSYLGIRQSHGATVRVTDLDGQYPLRHYVRHSPDGFEWGYGGSGPAELARCLLIDALDLHDVAASGKSIDRYVPPAMYQDFKAQMLSGHQLDELRISRLRVTLWVRDWYESDDHGESRRDDDLRTLIDVAELIDEDRDRYESIDFPHGVGDAIRRVVQYARNEPPTGRID